MKRKSLFILPVVIGLQFAFLQEAGAEAVQDTEDFKDAGETLEFQETNEAGTSSGKGWIKEQGGWRYYISDNKKAEGWHYLPERNDPTRYRWFYFCKGGCLFAENTRRDEKMHDTAWVNEYVGSIPYDTYDGTEYEQAFLENGWYFFSNPESNDGSDRSCYYVRNMGVGDYTFWTFSEGKWKLLKANESDEGTRRGYGRAGVRWNIIKDKEGTYTFVDRATGKRIGFKDASFSVEESGVSPEIIVSDKVDTRPEFFGAKGDGQSDDTMPIFHAVNTGETVVFSNTYYVSRTIDVKKDGVTLKGDGGVILTKPNLRNFMVKGKNVTFDSLTFQGHYSINEASDGSSIFFITEKDDGDVVDYNAQIKNCRFLQTGQRCIHIHSARNSDEDYVPISVVSGITVKDCEFDTYKLAVCCSGPDNVMVDGCSFSNGYYEHITFDWRSRNCKAVNNHFLSGERGIGAIGLDTAENIEIKNNDFRYTVLYGVSFNNEAGKSTNVVISGNRFKDGGGLGAIFFKSASEFGVAGENVTIKDNIFDNGTSESVLLNSAKGSVIFLGNEYLGKKPVVNTAEPQVTKDF